MITREDICAEAIEWTATPYQHQQMVKGLNGGVDCAMFIVGVALNVGLIDKNDLKNIPPYPREWHMHHDTPLLTDIMQSFGCINKETDDLEKGDIVVFSLRTVPCHLGIMLHDNLFVHANAGTQQKVVITPLERFWKKNLTQVYKFPGI